MQKFKEGIYYPFVEEYNRFINGAFLTDLLQFTGGRNAGTDYISKVQASINQKITAPFEDASLAVRQPNFIQFFSDNVARLFGGAVLQRLVTLCQAYPGIPHRGKAPYTVSHLFTEIMNEGAFRGGLKGLTLSLLQFSAVLYPAVYITNQRGKQTSLFEFLTTYTIMDTLLYPLDTIKTLMQSHTQGRFGFLQALNSGQLFNGYLFKAVYNLPLMSAFYFTARGDSQFQAGLSWLTTIALYPLLTMKVRAQTSVITSGLGANLYKGIVPFILLNFALGWSLRPLFSNAKLDSLEEEVHQELRRRHYQ